MDGAAEGSEATSAEARHGGRVVRAICTHALAVALIVVTVVAIGVGILLARLSGGPLSLEGMTDRIAQELGTRLGHGYGVTLGASSLERVGAGLRLSIAGLSIRDGEGHAVLAAPRASISVALAPLLLGQAKPTQVEIIGLQLVLTVREDGALAVSAGADPIVLGGGDSATASQTGTPPGTTAEALAPLARVLVGALSQLSDTGSPFARMESVGVSDAKLVFDDRLRGKTTAFDNLTLRFVHEGDKASLLVGGDGPSGRLQARANEVEQANGVRSVELEARDVGFDEIALLSGMREPGVFFDMPLSMRVGFALGRDDSIAGVNLRFNAGAGRVYIRDRDFEPFVLDELTGGVNWDAQSGGINIEPTEWASGDTHVTVSGRLAQPATAADPWRLELQSGADSVLGPEQPTDATVSLGDSRLAIAVFLSRSRLVVEQFAIGRPESGLNMTGEYDWSDESKHARAHLDVGRMPLRSALRIWPAFLAPPPRSWLDSHVDAGTLQGMTLDVDFDGPALENALKKMPPDDERVKTSFSVVGATVRFLPGVPPLSGLDVVGATTGHTVHVSAKKGWMEASKGRRVNIAEAEFAIGDTAVQPTPATVSARVMSSLDAMFDILSREGFRPFVGQISEPAAVSGQIDGKLGIDLLLDKKPRPDDTQVRATAQVADFVVDKVIGKEKFDEGNLALTVDRSGMHAIGPGRLLGQAAQIEFRKQGAGPIEANLGFIVDDAARARLAPAFATGLAGPVSARASSTISGKDVSPAKIELDFSKVAFDNPLPGLVKAAGRPAKAVFRVTPAGEGSHIDQLVFESSVGAEARGMMDLDAAGGLRAAHFTQLRLSPGDDMKVDLERGGDAIKLVARANAIDARPFLRGALGADASPRGWGEPARAADAPARDIDIDLKATLATGFNRQTLSNVDMRLSRRAGATRSIDLHGKFGGAGVDMTTQGASGGVPAITIASSDGGATLAFIDIYRRMEGGRLRSDLHPSASGLSGSIFISDFVLRDEPALRSIVSAGAPKVGQDVAKRIDTDAAAFQRLSGSFSRSGGQLRIADGVLYGSQIGLKLDGALDYAHDRVDMSGTFVPVYALNNLLTQIPVVGKILGGGDHEGIFAVTFRVTGPASAPSLVVNPLSALAPGFLRKIFGAGASSQPAAEDTPATIPAR